MSKTPERREPNTGRYQADVYQHKSRWESTLEIAIFLVVVCTLIATGLAARFTYGQWDVADDTEQRSLRASVLLNDLQIIPVQFNGTLIGFLVLPRWQNTAETSAAGLTFLINYRFSRDDLPVGFTAIDETETLEGPTDLAPKEILSVGGMRTPAGVPLYYPNSCFLDMQQDKFRYSYIWGWAKYHDVFKPAELRVTRFCRRIYGTYVSHNDLVLNQYLCTEGNCRDDDCKKYDTMPKPRMPQAESCRMLTIPIGAQAQPQQPQATFPPFDWPPSPLEPKK